HLGVLLFLVNRRGRRDVLGGSASSASCVSLGPAQGGRLLCVPVSTFSTLDPSIQRVFSLWHCTRTIELRCAARDAVCYWRPGGSPDAELEASPGPRAAGRV